MDNRPTSHIHGVFAVAGPMDRQRFGKMRCRLITTILLASVVVARLLSVYFSNDTRGVEPTAMARDSAAEEIGLLSPEQNPLPATTSSCIHLCICFFGLLRNLKSTISSYEDNLFSVLKSNSIRYSVYLHTFELSSPLYNPRSLDFGVNVDVNYTRLKPIIAIVEDQDEFDKKTDFDKFTTLGDPYEDDFRSHRNQVREGRSLEQVTRLWLNDNASCTHIFYTRPDLLLVAPFNVTELYEVRRMSWFTGGYHEFGGYNDRFAFGDPEGMKIWGNRIHHAFEYSTERKLIAEPFVKHVAEIFNIQRKETSLCLLRVRPKGINPSDVGVCGPNKTQ